MSQATDSMGSAPELRWDLAVVGAGMGGMTVAARASQFGLSCVVIESADQPGGSALLSLGTVWTLPTEEALAIEDPNGHDALGRVFVEDFESSLAWLAEFGVELGRRTNVLAGSGHQIDLAGYFRLARRSIEKSGGYIFTGTHVDSVTAVDDGYCLSVRQGTEPARIVVGNVCLATGGYQANADLVNQFITKGRGPLVLRSNTHSTGAGVSIASSLGAATTLASCSGFYGHLMPSSLPASAYTPETFVRLSQYHSEHGVLLNRFGERFTDESRGDHHNAVSLSRIDDMTAYLVIDERIQRMYVRTPYAQGMLEDDNKLHFAQSIGARYAEADSLRSLVSILAEWGIPSSAAHNTLVRFNAAMEDDKACRTLRPPRSRLRVGLSEPPFSVIEVTPAITFSYGGVITDEDGHALDRTGKKVQGLYAAGADIGRLYARGYAGGLSRSLVFGLRSGSAIALETGRRP